MKVLKHPLHIMLVHFPAALLPADLLFSVVSNFLNEESLTYAAFYVMCTGTLLGWATIITGYADLVSIREPALMRKVLIHGSINSLVVLAYSVLLFYRINQYPVLSPDSPIILTGKAGCMVLMIIGNWLGGNLILKEKIGVYGSD